MAEAEEEIEEIGSPEPTTTVNGWLTTLNVGGTSRTWATTRLEDVKERLASADIQAYVDTMKPNEAAKVRAAMEAFKGGELAVLPLGGNGRTGVFVQRQVFKM
jgi:hypothetical protein